MMRYTLIVDGVVVNMFVAEPTFVTKWMIGKTVVMVTDDSPVGIGWTYDGQNFFPPPPIIWSAADASDSDPGNDLK